MLLVACCLLLVAQDDASHGQVDEICLEHEDDDDLFGAGFNAEVDSGAGELSDRRPGEVSVGGHSSARTEEDLAEGERAERRRYSVFAFGVGHLRWNADANSLNAHCDRCSAKSDKVLRAFDGRGRVAQGRPLGYQLLFVAACPGTRAAHMGLRSTWSSLPDKAHAARERARADGRAYPRLAVLYSAPAELRPAGLCDDADGAPLELP